MDLLRGGLVTPENTPGEPINFTGKAVSITGAGEDLTRAYA